MAVIKKDGNIMALPLSISRGNPIALDATQVWYEKTQMEAYAKTDPTAYPGQYLTFVDEENKTVEAYVIANAEGTLVKLASTTSSGDVSADIIALQGRCTALEAKVETIEKSLEGISGFDFEVVEELPTTGEKGKIYLKAHEHGDKDVYDEYIWTGEAYEKIGNTDVDLSNYYTKGEVDTALETALEGKQASSANLTALSALTGGGLVRRKSDDTFALDASTYLTASDLEPYATAEALGNVQTAVEANENAIAAINNASTGILTQAKAYTDEKAYDDSALKQSIADNTSSIGTLNTKVDTIEDSLTEVKTTANANAAAITAINDESTGILALAKADTANKTAANKTLIDSLTSRVATVETSLAEKASQSALEAEINRAKAAEKKNEDAINLILDNPSTEAIDSIKELTKYVEEDGATTASLVNRLAGIGGENEPATVLAAIEASSVKVATDETIGGILTSSKFTLAENGAVSTISTDLLSQGIEELVLFGGAAK